MLPAIADRTYPECVCPAARPTISLRVSLLMVVVSWLTPKPGASPIARYFPRG